MANLFSPFSIKGLELKNRVVMPPMCQYSVTAKDGKPNNWHFVHYVSRAVGGTGLIIMEMTEVEPDGRITDYDLGLWTDEQVPAFARVIEECQRFGVKMGIQIGHAGRKAQDTESPVAPSAIPFNESSRTPRVLSTDEVKSIIEKFKNAARRAIQAGVNTIELHGAHGYLIHQFHSPLTNRRQDEYGKDLTKFGVEVVQAVRSEMPSDMPLIMRVSAIEYVENGYGIDYSIEVCKQYQKAGIDMFHITSGGEGPIGSAGRPGVTAGYQVPYTRAIKQALNVPVIAVGKLWEPNVAEAVISNEDADLVAVGRGLLTNPYWALTSAQKLGYPIDNPKQYERAF